MSGSQSGGGGFQAHMKQPLRIRGSQVRASALSLVGALLARPDEGCAQRSPFRGQPLSEVPSYGFVSADANSRRYATVAGTEDSADLYHRHQVELQQALRQSRNQPQSCTNSAFWPQSCVWLPTTSRWLFVPPLPLRPNGTARGCSNGSSPMPYLPPVSGGMLEFGGWAPASDVLNGAELLRLWNALAESHTSFECFSGRCRQIVRVSGQPGAQTLLDRETLQLCSASATASGDAIPVNCTPIARWDGRRVWMPVALGLDVGVGERDCTMSVVDAYELSATPVASDDDVTGRLRQALQATPLSLNVEPVRRGAVATSRRGRPSLVVPSATEWVTVEVRYGFPANGVLALHVSFAVLFSADGGSAGGAWRSPTPAELARYASALRDALRPQLEQLCAGAQWETEYRMRCPTRAP